MSGELRLLREKIEVLAGERGTADRQAVRIGALRARLQRVQIPEIRSTPKGDEELTAEVFNTLVSDLRALRQAIVQLRDAIQ